MSRYSLNLRPIYGRDEPTGGERISQGIQTAIDEYQQRQGRKRAEENAMAQAGAVRVPAAPAPSVMQRVRGIGSAIKRAVTGDEDADPTDADDRAGTLQPTGTFAPSSPRTPITGTGGIIPPSAGPARPGVVPGVAPALAAADQYLGTEPVARGVAAAQAGPIGTPAPTLPAPAQYGLAGARPSIASALTPYTMHGEFGDYAVDPNHAARVKATDAEIEAAPKIQALIDAGMAPGEARARVLNNVVRYDETFGEGPRSSRSGGMSAAEFDRRQNMRHQQNMELERLRQAGKITTQEFTRRRLDLQEQEAIDRRAAQADNLTFRAGTEEVRTNKEPGLLDRDPNEDPAAKDQRARGRARGKAMQQSAVTDAQRRANGGHDDATKARAAARARELKKAGKTDDQTRAILRAEGYDVQ